jgi:phosphatidate cytidylyltransferase
VITRLLAAAVGLAVLLPAIIFGGQLAVEIIVGIAAAICLWEFASMAFPDDMAVAFAWLVGCFGAWYGTSMYGPSELVSVVGGLVMLATFVFVTLRPGESLQAAADKVGRYMLGTVWVGLLMSLPALRRLDEGLAWVFAVLVISWCGDTGGYFAGKYFGRHKLYPLVSPKKTWEGVAGGVALATMGLFVVRAVALPVLSVFDVLVLGPVLCLAGVIGDLSESLLKRAFGVKDSGRILPGHGGLLDRIDSVLFVAPLLFAYVALIKGAA